MRKLFLFSVLFPFGLLAQITEDFSDGDFTQNPAWNGDMSHFKISSSTAIPQAQRPALQLDAPDGGVSALSVSQPFIGELEWQFWVKMSLNTSSGNFARIYLLSDYSDFKAPLDGYFLQIGGSEDSVIFYRQDSMESARLLRLANCFTGNSSNALRFRIFRNAEGNWKFYCDSLGGHLLNFQGEVNDLTFPDGNFFGLSCQYTSSNSTKFYFDDLYAGPLIVDTVAPTILQCRVVNPEEILLSFSEPVDLESVENNLSYEITPGIGHPYEAIRLLDPSQVHLFFDLELENGLEYTLAVSPVKDLAGNESEGFSLPVMYYEIMPYDLIITEIMADPTPPWGLPECEYLEVFNRCQVELNLEGLKLNIGSSDFDMPSYSILPGKYLLICDDDALEIMQHTAAAIGITSLVLPNSGATLLLTDTSGRTICAMQYDLSWYKDDIKAEGGWSLEMIDTGNPCKSGENWTASVCSDGGTPGKENSVAGQLENGLKITNACCLDDQVLLVEFNEMLNSQVAADTSHYLAEPFLFHPDSALPLPPDFRSVRLVFNEGFSSGQIYQLAVNPGLQNCVGDMLNSVIESHFAISQPAEPSDIVINEVLFNPLDDGVDYVEIYNCSSKTIDLEQIILASVKNVPPELPDTQAVDITSLCHVIFPGQYLALTSDPEMVKSQYHTEDPEAFMKLSYFPSYNNDQGCVLLMNRAGEVIDGMNYSEEMHFLMLLSVEGVSLERISPERPGSDPSNWHSSAETAGFGTPGYKNSQFLAMSEKEDALSIQPKVFSPDGDGRDDNLGIFYNFESPGKLITVLIFDADGRLARMLVNNEMPGTEGFYSWDGTLDDRTSAQNGIYIIYLEALDMNGKTRQYKKAGVLARNR